MRDERGGDARAGGPGHEHRAEVELPAALVEALDAEGLRSTFDALAPSRRTEHARSLTEARSEGTRARRVANVIDALPR
ncbi:YdeI/OmpD-associated family protein [Aeromicrobium halocynthiae]|uniref:YdeI/OmpD-associated family protein n=1 Tax=Aeromicrobium halocynthiae TaxID=560557 RepID=UPI0031E165D3